MVEEGYRVPTKEEFVEGFTFEYLHISGGGSFMLVGVDTTDAEKEEQLIKNRQPIVTEWRSHTIPTDIKFNVMWDLWFDVDYAINCEFVRVKI
jgi:hypothetical protein